MKVIFIFLIFIIFFQQRSSSQSLIIDFAGGGLTKNDALVVSQGTYHSEAFTKNNLCLNLRASYINPSFVLSPVIHTLYYFRGPFSSPNLQSSGLVIGIGTEKVFTVGYSRLIPSLAIGYTWEHFKIQDSYASLSTSGNNNGMIYLADLSLVLPFIKNVDAIIVYTFVFKTQNTIEGKFAQTNFSVTTAEARHQVSFGISFTILDQKEAK
ncbi:MAG: hypothetical protein HY800_06600 [Ignavibacteriales bacterium]|nr:hypothetical protein [Ignavibacteriales bacterium]